MTALVLSVLAGVILFVGLIASVQIVQPVKQRAYTVLGTYKGTLKPGVNFVVPFISSVYEYDMREQTVDIPEQELITNDNAPIKVDGVIYTKLNSPRKAFLEVEDYHRAVRNLAQTTLRAVIGEMDLDDTLNQRDKINARIREELAEPTDNWGVEITKVEIKNVHPSKEVRDAMEEQTSAERQRRAMVTKAKGQKRSQILKAEGEKQSRIIEAEGERQERIRVAMGESRSIILRALASRTMGEQATIVRSLEAMETAAQEKSNSFFFPAELSNTIGRLGRYLSDSDFSSEDMLEEMSLDDFPEEIRDIMDPSREPDDLDDPEEIDTEDLDQDIDEDIDSVENNSLDQDEDQTGT
jgi:regulator of protease activity HflC (stomatin/prohibitin superfamily)